MVYRLSTIYRFGDSSRTFIPQIDLDTDEMASSAGDGEAFSEEIHLWREGQWWVIKDVETGVTTQGRTREDALDNLDEAVAGYHGVGKPPSEADLEALNIDPEKNTSGNLRDSEIFE